MAWRHRDERYAEKLATPDTSVADLIGDVDPMKVAEGRTLGDPETIHYGLVPRSNRGIIAINELPDLAERIQVAMLNVMEERDIQIRGYVLRLPLDVLVVASANPEDYTNRGRIITPLKDRFGAEIRTHYPIRARRRGRRHPAGGRPGRRRPAHLVEILARYTRALRESPAINQRSGRQRPVRDRRRRNRRRRGPAPGHPAGRGAAVARIIDLETAVEVLAGKIEFESGEEGREQEVLNHLLRTATAEAVRDALPRPRLRPLVAALEDGPDGHHRRAGHRARVPRGPAGLPPDQVGESASTTRSASASRRTTTAPARRAIELALEGLYLARRIAKESDEAETVYG